MLSLEVLRDLAQEHSEAPGVKVREFQVAGRMIASNARRSIMGVINLSVDSWYRESVCPTVESAVRRAFVLEAQGADVVDIGAESTLAHAARLDEGLQGSKLLPVLDGLKGLKIPISVETYNLAVARRCLEAGARVINLTGTEETDGFYRLAREFDAAVIVCFVEGRNVREVGEFSLERDAVEFMYEYFAREVERAEKAGLQKVFIDPGLGFYYRNLQDSAVRVRHQMRVFLNTFRLRGLGYPVCHALPHAFEYFGEEVRSAEPFFAVLAAFGKTDLFRTHEVARVRAVLNTLEAF
ncbi:MAG TPA: dihydropteroate synthase [Verrucomicrobiae bacterium]